MKMFSAEDHAFMSRALALTARGRDTATPNPNVGCVIVKGGRLVAEGWHERAGEAHAEVRALEAASEPPAGATAYLTLEPCSHQGRTPPCVDALIAAKVGRVVCALEDPNPQVRGAGIRRLREAGIRADVGLMAAQAEETHRGFLKRMRTGRPWMRIKAAASLDGGIALANGSSRWITGEAARRDVHALRARSCAMLTGIGTVRHDDPELTVRMVPCSRQPQRVLIDHRLEIPLSARLLQGEPLIILTVSDDGERRAALESRGAEVVRVPGDGRKADLAAIVALLAERGFNEVTVETGGKLMGSLVRAKLIDELVLYVAPMLLGDAAQGLFAMGELLRLDQAPRVRIADVRHVGEDFRITARLGDA
jgi:diaminohydroxyphosphoribosylaminopyrimidine deaminase/5-amino-6-(5-phosphoribosylamino)uracil reductase